MGNNSTQQQDRPNPTKQTVLVVEDDADIMLSLTMRLNNSGYVAIPAPDGFSALAVARSKRIEVAIVDLNLPGVSGMDVLRTFSGSGIKTMVITASKSTQNRREAESLGCSVYIEKPFTGSFLVAKLNELVATTASKAS